jgi:hypothetical protein
MISEAPTKNTAAVATRAQAEGVSADGIARLPCEEASGRLDHRGAPISGQVGGLMPIPAARRVSPRA